MRRFAPIEHLCEPLIIGGEAEIAVAQWRVVGAGCPLAGRLRLHDIALHREIWSKCFTAFVGQAGPGPPFGPFGLRAIRLVR
jgi:hypothetical protein